MISTILSLVGLAVLVWVVNALMRAHRRRLLNERLNAVALRPGPLYGQNGQRMAPLRVVGPGEGVNPTATDFDAVMAFRERVSRRLRVECSWCGLTMQEGLEPVSHGICPDCARDHFKIELPPAKEVQG